MTLDEAIKHAEEAAEEQDRLCKRYDDASGYSRSHNETIRTTDAIRCEEYADVIRQFAKWLKELKDYRERIPSYEAGYNDAKIEIALSGEYERAYERGKQDAEQTRWIPVSERLPEEYGEYMITWTTSHSMVGGKYGLLGIAEYELSGEYDHENNRFKGDWLLEDYVKNYPNVEVIAWMPLPEPYEPQESEVEDA